MCSRSSTTVVQILRMLYFPNLSGNSCLDPQGDHYDNGVRFVDFCNFLIRSVGFELIDTVRIIKSTYSRPTVVFRPPILPELRSYDPLSSKLITSPSCRGESCPSGRTANILSTSQIITLRLPCSDEASLTSI